MDGILQARRCETTKNEAVSDTVINERQSIAEAQLQRHNFLGKRLQEKLKPPSLAIYHAKNT